MDSSLLKLWRRLQGLTKVFRFIELCILLALLSWLSVRLPFAVKISSEYVQKFITLIFSHICIFFLGNAIVVTLLAKSGLFTGQSPPSIDNAVAELYEELRSDSADEILALLKEEVVFQDKEIICEESRECLSPSLAVVTEEKPRGMVFSNVDAVVKVSHRRTQSENARRESEKEEVKLRRSETDVCRKNFTSGSGEKANTAADVFAATEDFLADGMSDEEFNRAIEAFIAKQVRFHRKERLSVVLHGQA